MPHQCTNCGRAFEDGSKEMLSGCPDCGGNKFQFLPASAVDAAGPETEGSADAAARAGGTAPKKTPETSGARTGAREAAGAAGRGSSAPDAGDDGPSSAVDRAAATVRDWVGTGGDADDRDRGNVTAGDSARSDASANGSAAPETSSDIRAPDAPPTAEDAAQANARSDIVSDAELPDDPPADVAPADEPPADVGPADVPADGEVVDTPDDDSPGLEQLREELNSQFESIRITEPGQYELNLMELYEREEYIIALQEDGKYVIEVPDGWKDPDR